MFHVEHIIAVTNQKGGVGKTTTSVNVAFELARMGRRVLLIDFDPQSSATSGVGLQLRTEGGDLFDLFFGKVTLSNLITPTAFENLDAVPSSKDLVGLEIELGKSPGRELILRSELKLLSGKYDYVVIDCPPSSGLLTLNALGAANHVLIPMQAEYYALEGLSSLLGTVEFVKSTFNPHLEILGVVATMFDNRTNLAIQVWGEVQNFFLSRVFATKVPRNVKISEAPSHGMPVGAYDPSSSGAKAYRALAIEVDERVLGVGDRVANG